MYDIIKEKRFKWLAGLFVFFTAWFVVENILDIDSGRIFSWSNFYFILPLYGAIYAIIISRSWGGTKSTIGKTIQFFSLGLLFQVIGQCVYSYFSVTVTLIPYPGWSDIFYFGTIPIYIYATVLLSRIVGLGFSINSIRKRLQAVLIPIVLLIFSYILLLRGYIFDWSDPLRIFLDFGYSLGDAIYVSLALLIFLFSSKNLASSIYRPVMFIVFALIFQYSADYIFTYKAFYGSWVNGGFGDYLYLVAYLVMSFALLQFRTTITFPITNFSHLVQQIISEQEKIIGPLAWQEAQRVRGLIIDFEKNITFTQDPTAVVERLLEHFEHTFGSASREKCQSIVRQFMAKLPPGQQSATLYGPAERMGYVHDELYRHNSALADLNTKQARFLADISHELQSPLVIAKGTLHSLQSHYQTDQSTKALDTALYSLERLSKLVNDLLLLAKADFDQLDIKKAPVDVSELLQELFTTTQVWADEKSVEYRLQAPHEVMVISADREKLAGVFVNILSNAFKYVLNSGRVTISLTKDNDTVRVAVYNSGEAIPPEDIPHLFERFYQRQDPQQRKKGTGLGLSIAKTIVEKHGGTIGVRNVDGGVEFWVEV